MSRLTGCISRLTGCMSRLTVRMSRLTVRTAPGAAGAMAIRGMTAIQAGPYGGCIFSADFRESRFARNLKFGLP